MSGSQPHLLAVDDDGGVLRLLTMLLESWGYRVTSCGDPRRALRLFCESPDKYALVLTDTDMPHLSGWQLAAKLFAVRKDVPIILSSGRLERPVSEVKAFGFRAFCAKPYSQPALRAAILQALAPDEAGPETVKPQGTT